MGLVSGCSAILGIHDAEILGDSGVDGSFVDDGSSGTDVRSSNDAPGTADDGAANDSGFPVPTAMVTVAGPAGNFDIDVTEVTQRQYADFLERGTGTITQTIECSTNLSFTPPASFTPDTTPNVPVVSVDWCDATAYCTWVGKRLCGGVGGQPGLYATASAPNQNEWLFACSKAGTQQFPYGEVEQANACNVHAPDGGGLEPVGTHTKCEGGYLGLFDLVGNATEWVNHCDDAGTCAILGGSFSFPPTGSVTCSTLTATGRAGLFPDLSFRCCR